MKFIILSLALVAGVVYGQPRPQGYYGAIAPIVTPINYDAIRYVPVSKPSSLEYATSTSTLAEPPKPIVYESKPLKIETPPKTLSVDKDKEEETFVPQPFNYAYDFVDEFGTQMSRSEQADESGVVRGSYSYRDVNGLARIVNYIADASGYRAEIQTNEPGTESSQPADVAIISSNPSTH